MSDIPPAKPVGRNQMVDERQLDAGEARKLNERRANNRHYASQGKQRFLVPLNVNDSCEETCD